VSGTRWTIAEMEENARGGVIGGLQQGASHAHACEHVDRYLREHCRLDPVKWAWTVRAPWRGGVLLPTWKPKDVSVTITERSAVDRLGEIA